jgi:branched-chain amino acid transport system substrate-binding protein
VLEAYKAAVERAYAFTGKWPTKLEIARTLPGIMVATPSGYRGYSMDKRMLANNFIGVTTHDNPYDFVTIKDVAIQSSPQVQTPMGMQFHDWVKSWKKI